MNILYSLGFSIMCLNWLIMVAILSPLAKAVKDRDLSLEIEAAAMSCQMLARSSATFLPPEMRQRFAVQGLMQAGFILTLVSMSCLEKVL